MHSPVRKIRVQFKQVAVLSSVPKFPGSEMLSRMRSLSIEGKEGGWGKAISATKASGEARPVIFCRRFKGTLRIFSAFTEIGPV